MEGRRAPTQDPSTNHLLSRTDATAVGDATAAGSSIDLTVAVTTASVVSAPVGSALPPVPVLHSLGTLVPRLWPVQPQNPRPALCGPHS